MIISCIVIIITSFFLGIKFFSNDKVISKKPQTNDSSEMMNAGIAAVQVYFPAGYVNLKELSKSNGKENNVSDEECVSFCGDNEDSVSMALSVVHNLMESHRITPQQVSPF